MDTERKQPVIRDINASDDDQMPMSVESLCMACEEMGVTRLMLTRIPYFKEVIISSFECPHCDTKNNSIQSVGSVQDNGIRYELKAEPQDLNRQVVKSASACMKIPELNFEIPAFSQQGELSTIEGVLERAMTALAKEQPVRKVVDPKTCEKIEHFLGELEKYKKGQLPFTFVIDDISGNSFVENPIAPKNDKAMTITRYVRTADQDKTLGIANSADKSLPDDDDEPRENATEEFDATQEVMEFPTICPNCQKPATTNMKAVDIPFFKQVILMATNCAHCGNRSNEVKSGSGIEEKGCKITLKLTDITDLARDVLKSDTCFLRIPELDLELQSGTLGGRFTTLEGLFVNVKENLQGQHPFGIGDTPSAQQYESSMKTFLDQMDKIIEGTRLDITVVLDDAAGNSYLQNVYAPDKDPNMTIEYYIRTHEQNEDLGLSELLIQEHEDEKRKVEGK